MVYQPLFFVKGLKNDIIGKENKILKYTNMYKPVVLVVLDGWGVSTNSRGNVLKETPLPTIEKLDNFYPMTTLQASGISVGLFWGEPGNSEVGHMSLGSGRIIYQNLPKITLSIQDGTFFKNEALLGALENAVKKGTSLHLMGLVGEGSVHSYAEHIQALLEAAKNAGLEKVYIHAFTDGRDSPPTSGTQSISKLQAKMKSIGVGKIATVCGRNWAMDRNNNWDRIEKAYRMLTESKGELAEDPIAYMQSSYARGVTDEYLEPCVITEDGQPVAKIQNQDSVIFFNFREDRARQLTQAFTLPGFEKIKKDRLETEFVTLTEYEKDMPVKIMFPPDKPIGGLGELLSKKGLRQLRIAETEKYAHVTYFFNEGKEEPWPGEDRLLVPSPSVSKFDEKPEMSSAELTQKLVDAIELGKYDFILANYANADMVGHTGNSKAASEAVTAIDKSLSILIPVILKAGGCLLITADHGNVEEITNFSTGQINTEHSSNPVPLWLVTPDNHRQKSPEEIARQQAEVGGLLSDVAPTILEIMGIEKAPDMSGESLLSTLK